MNNSNNSLLLDFGNSTDSVAPKGLVSDFTLFMFTVLVFAFSCGVVSLAGIVANVINLIVFIRQGILAESVTASLAGLALADLCCVSTMFLHSINIAISLSPPPDIPWDPFSVLYVVTGWPRIMFTRLTCWVTAYVALERCLCVVLPFKVKQLFTARRTLIIISCLFVFIIASYVPIYYTHRLENVFDPKTNTSKVILVLADNVQEVEYVCRHINDIILPSLSLSTVIICTQLTITRLKASTKWKKKNANSGQISNSNGSNAPNEASKQVDSKQLQQKTTGLGTSTKETRVVKMITLICTIFIICNSPCVIIFYIRLLIPNISNGQLNHNLFRVLYSIDFLIETINSSINIVVYYKMSTKYKQEFRILFGLKNDND